MSSLRRGHANLLCIVPILTDDPRRASETETRASDQCNCRAGVALPPRDRDARKRSVRGSWPSASTTRPHEPPIHCRSLCIPLWAVFPPLQVVLSSACSVASLSRFPSHYLPGHPHLREGALAAYLFGQGSPSTWCTGLTAVHDTPSAKLPCGAQRGVTLPRCSS